MKTLYRLGLLYTLLTLTSCASTSTPNKPIDQAAMKNKNTLSHSTHAALKNPLSINFYQRSAHLKRSFTVIGTESVSKYNSVGIKRQEATIRDTMRKLAAAMGGDAVVDITHNKTLVTGTVVSFDKPSYDG